MSMSPETIKFIKDSQKGILESSKQAFGNEAIQHLKTYAENKAKQPPIDLYALVQKELLKPRPPKITTIINYEFSAPKPKETLKNKVKKFFQQFLNK